MRDDSDNFDIRTIDLDAMTPAELSAFKQWMILRGHMERSIAIRAMASTVKSWMVGLTERRLVLDAPEETVLL